MFLISLIVLFLSIVPASADFANADTSFEVKKLPDNALQFIARENGVAVFDHYAAVDGPRVVSNNICSWQRTNAGVLWEYQGHDSSHIVFLVAYNGDISLSHGLHKTNYEFGKSWGFKTHGIITNKQEVAFAKISMYSQQLHNLGVIKCLTSDFHHDYYFNKGIMHFGDPSPVADRAAYTNYSSIINNEAAVPNYQQFIIDDYGVIIAEAGLKITGLTHHIHGFVDAQDLTLDNASLDVEKSLFVHGSIKGVAPSIAVRGLMSAGSINQSLHITDWVNNGQVYCDKPSLIHVHGILDNNGWLVGGNSLSIHSQKPPKFLGKVLSNGDLQTIVDEFWAAVNGRTFSKNGKATIDVLTIWHHRAIRKWYWLYPDGRKVYRYTEGPFFTGETTEERRTETIDSGEIPTECQDLPKRYMDSMLRVQAARDALKDHLRGLPQAQKAALLSILAEALRGAGLSAGDIQDIMEDGEVAAALAGISNYESMTPEARSQLATSGRDSGRCVVSVVARAQAAGMRAVDWIKANGVEFINEVCDLTRMAAARVPHPYLQRAAGVCNVGQMGDKALRGFKPSE